MWKLWWLRWWLRRWLRWWLWQLQQLQMLPGGLLHQLLPLLLWLLWGLLQRPRGLLPPPHLQLQLVWLRRWEGLLPAEELLSAEVQLPNGEGISYPIQYSSVSLVSQLITNLPTM